MRFSGVRLLLIALCLGLTTGCVRTLGAPTGEDEYDAESNQEAMQDEEDEEAWRDVNR
jgi:hypothetical protein